MGSLLKTFLPVAAMHQISSPPSHASLLPFLFLASFLLPHSLTKPWLGFTTIRSLLLAQLFWRMTQWKTTKRPRNDMKQEINVEEDLPLPFALDSFPSEISGVKEKNHRSQFDLSCSLSITVLPSYVFEDWLVAAVSCGVCLVFQGCAGFPHLFSESRGQTSNTFIYRVGYPVRWSPKTSN